MFWTSEAVPAFSSERVPAREGPQAMTMSAASVSARAIILPILKIPDRCMLSA